MSVCFVFFKSVGVTFCPQFPLRQEKLEITMPTQCCLAAPTSLPFHLSLFVSVPLGINQLIKLDIYWRKRIQALCLLIVSYAKPLSHRLVFVYVSLDVLIPGQQHAAKNVGLKGIQFNAEQVPFLKGSAVSLVVEVWLAE